MTLRNLRRSIAGILVGFIAIGSGATPAAAASFCRGQRATIVGSRGVDFLVGTPGNDVIAGRTGSDQIYGRGGNDLICGGKGGDYVVAGPGDDVVYGNRGIDDLFGDEDDDVLVLGTGNSNTGAGGPGDDRLIGGPGLDFANHLGANAAVDIDLSAGEASGEGTDQLESIDGVMGTRFDDTIVGHEGTNVLVGAGGADDISAEGNAGSLTTNPRTQGVDILVGDGDPQARPADDVLEGGPGLNVADYTLAPVGLFVDLDNGNATGEGSDHLIDIQVVAGSEFDDTLIGDDAANGFRPFSGNDRVVGGDGADVAVFTIARLGVTADLVAGTASGEGSDSLESIEYLWGSPGPDRLTGDSGDNSLFGFRGRDRLSGAEGSDVLNGGKGSDTLDGGDGDDRCTAGEITLSCEAPPWPGQPGRIGARLLRDTSGLAALFSLLP